MKLNQTDSLIRALQAPIPARTDTYTPIPHSDFLSSLQTKLDTAGYNITSRRIYINGLATKLVGFIDIEDRNNPYRDDFGFRMMMGFKNSYDKSMVAGLAIGATVFICSNGVVSGDLITFRRKHTGTVQEELNEKIDLGISLMGTSFQRLISDAEIMRNYEISPKQKAEILGVMYFEEEIVSPTQLSVIKREIKHSEHFREPNLWSLYNNVTEALKTSHPMRLIDDHIRLHDFMSNIAGIRSERHVVQEEQPVIQVMETMDQAIEINNSSEVAN